MLANCGATTLGSTTSFGSGFLGGSGSGGTICLSAARGNLPNEGGVTVLRPPPPPPPESLVSGVSGRTTFCGVYTMTAVSLAFVSLGTEVAHGTKARTTIPTWTPTESSRGNPVLG